MTYDITPTTARTTHARALASAATLDRHVDVARRLPRLAALSAALGILLSLGAVVARAAETPVVNVNTASATELAFLPGIGEKTADNVLYAREQGVRFETCQDLQAVSGIGEKTAAKLCPYVVFDGPTTATAPVGASGKTTTKKYKRPESR